MANIFIIDDLPPETLAMLQALYSRSPESVKVHHQKVLDTGSDKFMESFYVGYGHSSIGDCGTTTIFFENVSFLFEKALQDNPLYNGQACSSRYLDFKNQPLTDPINTDLSKQILTNWINFYSLYSNQLLNKFLKDMPCPDAELEKQKVWNKAIKARVFDIMRGFLPVACNTQVSWTTSLRQSREKLYQLSFHPLKEVSEIAVLTLAQLKEKYPASFSHRDNLEMDAYYDKLSKKGLFYNESLNCYVNEDNGLYDNFIVVDTPFSIDDCYVSSTLFKERPKWSPLPKYLNDLGNFIFDFVIDYGSFRDIQRHRNGTCTIPLITRKYGFEDWYIEQFPEEMQESVSEFVNKQLNLITELKEKENVSVYDLQYYYPLGIRVPVRVVYNLPQAVYVAELRSQQTVHHTLRVIAQEMGKVIEDIYGDVIKLYIDYSDTEFTAKRGKQDIIKK